MQPNLRILPQLSSLKVAFLAAFVAVLAVTCAVSGVGTTPTSADESVEGGPLVVGTTEEPTTLASVGDDATPAPVPSSAPAEGIPSAPVEPAPRASEVGSAQTDTGPDATQFPKVKVQQPRLRVAGLLDRADLRRIRRLNGVRFATAFSIGTVNVGTQNTPVTVAAVDPEEFRRMTPQVTADAVAVWQRIVEGDAAFTHDVGNRLKAELGSFVPTGTEGFTLRVGAYASNGIPPVADAIISPETAAQLGVAGRQDVLVSLRPGADPDGVAEQIEQRTGAQVDVIEEPQTRRAFLTGADARNAFEPFTYIDMGDGMIQIDPDWVRRNIVRRAMPLLKGEVVCHRLMVDQLYGALKEIEDSGLGHLIDPSQYGGCWVPRHIDFNPAKPLSMHGWGLAADFNVSTNGLGMKPQMDPRIVAVFDKWGFVWGGRWSRPDGMHFELGALIQNSPQG